MLKRLWKSEKGFTLMELIIVIVILGILALIAIPRLIGFVTTSEVAADEEYAAVFTRACELYWAANKSDTAEVWADIYDNVTGTGASTLQPLADEVTKLQQYDTMTLSMNSETGFVEIGLSGSDNADDVFYNSRDGYYAGSIAADEACDIEITEAIPAG